MYDTDESASEYNIRVDGFEENFRESAHQNKKAYSITMIKDTDGSNDYRSGISFHIYPLPIGTFTMIFEYYWPESTNVSLSTQGTTVYIHKQVYLAFDTYGKLLVQINNNSKTTPDRITLVIHGRAVVQNPEGYLVIYGIKGWSDSVDPRVYDGLKNEMYAEINMNNHKIINLADPVDDSDALTKKWVKNNTSDIYLAGPIFSDDKFILPSIFKPLILENIFIKEIMLNGQYVRNGMELRIWGKITKTQQHPQNYIYIFNSIKNKITISINKFFSNIDEININPRLGKKVAKAYIIKYSIFYVV